MQIAHTVQFTYLFSRTWFLNTLWYYILHGKIHILYGFNVLCVLFRSILAPTDLCNCGIISFVLPISRCVCVLLRSCAAQRVGSEWIPEASYWECLFSSFPSLRAQPPSSVFQSRQKSAQVSDKKQRYASLSFIFVLTKRTQVFIILMHKTHTADENRPCVTLPTVHSHHSWMQPKSCF